MRKKVRHVLTRYLDQLLATLIVGIKTAAMKRDAQKGRVRPRGGPQPAVLCLRRCKVRGVTARALRACSRHCLLFTPFSQLRPHLQPPKLLGMTRRKQRARRRRSLPKYLLLSPRRRRVCGITKLPGTCAKETGWYDRLPPARARLVAQMVTACRPSLLCVISTLHIYPAKHLD